MKKILFISYDFPYPTNTGGKNRAYNMLRHSGDNLQKFLFSFIRSDFDRRYIKEMERIGVRVLKTVRRRSVFDPRNILGILSQQSIFNSLYFSRPVLSDIISAVSDFKIDSVHFESFYTSFFINDQIRKLGAKQIFGTENIEFKIYEDYCQNNVPALLKPLYELQVKSIKKEETELFKMADLCIAVSERDAKEIRKYNSKCEIIRNGVDIDEFEYTEPKNKRGTRLLFVGNFTYFPNVDGITYFYNSVFKNLGDDVSLTIVGKKVNTLPFINDRRITCKEFVPKIADEYNRADLVVSPLRLGGGTNFKILEAMAKGVPVVSLPSRLEGLDVKNEKDIVIVNNDNEFIAKIEVLLNDLELRKKIARSARDFVESEYSWEVIGRKLADVWDSL